MTACPGLVRHAGDGHGAPNDEALPGHRLYDRGLAELAGAGLIAHSERIARLEQVNRVHPGHEAERFSRQHHYIVPLKESIVEVVAEPVAVQRQPGPPLRAASLALWSVRRDSISGRSARSPRRPRCIIMQVCQPLVG